jgi:hypothetical protein
MQRQLMVQDAMSLFNFVHDGACASRIRRKILNALSDNTIPERTSTEPVALSSPQTAGQENSLITLEDQYLRGQEDPNLEAKRLYPCDNSSQGKQYAVEYKCVHRWSGDKMGNVQKDAVPTIDKPTVYLGHGFSASPCNIAFRQFALSKQSDYRMSNPARRQSMVQDAMR